jgi:hypothetical protein
MATASRQLDPQAYAAMTAMFRRTSTGAKAVFACVGLAMLVGAGLWGWRSYDATTSWSRAEGTVLRVESRKTGDGYRSTPIIGYVDDAGVPREMTPSVSTNMRSIGVGRKVTVLHQPTTGKAALDDVHDLWVFPVALAGFGLVFTLVGLFARVTVNMPGMPPPQPRDAVARAEQDEPPAPLIR